MARKRTGRLVERKSGWRAHVTLTIDGETVRKMVDLETKDRTVARRKLRRLLADNEHASEADALAAAAAPITVAEAVEQAHQRWVDDDIADAATRLGRLQTYALPYIGDRRAGDVKGADISEVLLEAKKAGLSKQTVRHIRNGLNSVFKDLWLDEVISDNPVKRSRMPKMKERKKRRAMLTDEELRTFLDCPDVDFEIKMLVLVSRTIGGMRSGDCNALTWSSFGPDFETCEVPRAKTDTPQVLAVPEVARPWIAAWWRALGSPDDGPVFPVRRGERAGEAKRAGNMSYAKRLRRELGRALGVEAVATWTGKRWKEKDGHRFSPRERELFAATDRTLPVDFHSTRRAYASALAAANINAQTAQLLTGHSDPEVHQRYVAQTVVALPAEATPSIPAHLQRSVAIRRGRSEKPESSRRAWQNSNLRPLASEASALSS